MPRQQLRILNLLRAFVELTPAQVGNGLGITENHASVQLGNLYRSGHVQRRRDSRCDGNRRRFLYFVGVSA